jgi:hypothetical protein
MSTPPTVRTLGRLFIWAIGWRGRWYVLSSALPRGGRRKTYWGGGERVRVSAINSHIRVVDGKSYKLSPQCP